MESPGVRPASTQGTAPARVLIVDDEVAIRLLVERTLQLDGFETLLAGSGQEAIRVAAAVDRIDLVVADVNLPGEGGRMLATLVAAHHPAVKVIYISGLDQQTLLSEGIITATASFLAKPFTGAALRAAVAHALAG